MPIILYGITTAAICILSVAVAIAGSRGLNHRKIQLFCVKAAGRQFWHLEGPQCNVFAHAGVGITSDVYVHWQPDSEIESMKKLEHGFFGELAQLCSKLRG